MVLQQGLCTIVQQHRHMERISFLRVTTLDLPLQTKFLVPPLFMLIYQMLLTTNEATFMPNVLHIQN